MADEWITAGGGDGKMWDESTGPIQGQYVKKRSNVGPNESMVYTLRTDTGEEIGVWGSTVINTKFEEIAPGSIVRVEYLGKVSAKRGGSQYKDYRIQYKPGPALLHGAENVKDEKPTYPDQPEGKDVVIKDIDVNQNINLDDIPF